MIILDYYVLHILSLSKHSDSDKYIYIRQRQTSLDMKRALILSLSSVNKAMNTIDVVVVIIVFYSEAYLGANLFRCVDHYHDLDNSKSIMCERLFRYVNP